MDKPVERASGSSSLLAVKNAFTFVLGRLDPIKGTYQRDFRSTLLSLAERPSLWYQFGFTDEPGSDILPLTGTANQQQTRTLTESYSLNTGTKLPWEITAEIGFNYTYNKTDNTSSVSEKKSTTFPDIKLTWGKIGQLGFFKKYTTSVRAQSAYKYTTSSTITDGKKTSDMAKHDMAPLFSLNASWKNGVQSNFVWNKNITDTKTTGLQKDFKQKS